MPIWRIVAFASVVMLGVALFMPWATFYGIVSLSMLDFYKFGIGPGQMQILEKSLGGPIERYNLQDTFLAMIMTVVLYPIALMSALAALYFHRSNFLLPSSGVLAVMTALSSIYAIESLKSHLGTPGTSAAFLGTIMRVDFGAYITLFAGILLVGSYFLPSTSPVAKEETKSVAEPAEIQRVDDYAKAVALTTMFCRECGQRIPRDSKYCKECGTKVV